MTTYLGHHGCEVIPQTIGRGVADTLVIPPGKPMFFIEYKGDGGTVSVEQVEFMSRVVKLGHRVALLDPDKDLDKELGDWV